MRTLTILVLFAALSFGSFAAAQTITVTAPNGAETWTEGQQATITWNSTGSPGNVDIELSVNSGSTYTVNLATNTVDDGTETITVPANAATTCRVRVSDNATSTILDESDADFTIVTPSITVTAPNGAETWTEGQQATVTWTSVGSFGNVDIDLSVNSGSTYTVSLAAGTADDGTETITVPANAATTCRVRVSDSTSGTILDESDADFTIVTPSVTVTAPNGAENWTVGGSQNVTWNSVGSFGTVDIDLSLNSGSTYTVNLATGTTDDGTESITVPNNPGTTCRIRVRDNATGAILDESDADFTISVAQSITVTAPNGGETWVVGQNGSVTWNSTGSPGNVDIDLSLNSGSTYTVNLATNTTDDGTETITVPNNPGTTCRVRVRDNATGTILDESDADFTIASPSITVTAPNGGESWTIAGTQSVTWTSVGVTGTVEIDLSTDGGSTFPTSLASASTNDGTESITVPNLPSTMCRVRVSDTATGTILDESDANFTITAAPTITVTAPNGGENLLVGNNMTVTWSSGGSPGNVDILLSTNSGSSYTVTLASNTSDDGTETITVPNNPATTCRVRVVDNASGTIMDDSDADFTIAVPAPAAGTLSASGNPGSQNANPGSTRSALGFRITETGGASTLTVTGVTVRVTMFNNTGGLAEAAVSSISLRRGSTLLATQTSANWTSNATTITCNFTGLSEAITASGTGDFTVSMTFAGTTVPTPNPSYSAQVTTADISSASTISGATVTGGTITLIDSLPGDPLDEDDDDDSCDLASHGGPAWPLALAVLFAFMLALRRRRETI